MSFEVINTGVEIPPAELPRLFDKFYRLPSTDPWKQSGTGLGLALARQLSLRLGGSLQAISAQQQTCFRLSLPLNGTPETETVPNSVLPAVTGVNLTMLALEP
jgi:signal transduction histidine kinase